MKPVDFSVIASQRIRAESAFTRVFDTLWRGPMAGSAKQSRTPSLSLRRKRGRVGVGACFVGFASSQ